MISQARRPNLDGLRACAVIFVMFHHTRFFVDPNSWIFSIINTGWNGIFLFFLLSGYLIGSVLLKELFAKGEVSKRTFWYRRVFRTWPVYFVVIALQVIRIPSTPFSQLLPYLTFTQNIFGVPFLVATWSIAVQEQFYFLLPLAIQAGNGNPAVTRSRLRFTLWSGFAIGLAGIMIFNNIFTVGAMAPLMLGVCIAHAEQTSSSFLSRLRGRANLSFTAGLAVAYLPFYFLNEGPALYFAQLAGWGLVVSVATSDKPLWAGMFLNSKIMGWAALVSYSTYLIEEHTVIRAQRWISLLGLQGTFAILLTLATVAVLSFSVGGVFYFLFERPFMKLRNKFFSSRREPSLSRAAA